MWVFWSQTPGGVLSVSDVLVSACRDAALDRELGPYPFKRKSVMQTNCFFFFFLSVRGAWRCTVAPKTKLFFFFFVVGGTSLTGAKFFFFCLPPPGDAAGLAGAASAAPPPASEPAHKNKEAPRKEQRSSWDWVRSLWAIQLESQPAAFSFLLLQACIVCSSRFLGRECE